MKKSYLPIAVELFGQPCLVVGGGALAEKKIRSLINVQAKISILASHLSPPLQTWVESGRITHEYSLQNTNLSHFDLSKYRLIFAASDNNQINQKISVLAKAKNIPINVADEPSMCSFIMPTIIDRNPVQIAITTAGLSPTLGRLLKTQLEPQIPSSCGRLAELLGLYKDKAKRIFPDKRERDNFWEKVLHGSTTELLHSGQEKAAVTELEKAFEGSNQTNRGSVALIGCGPGDPDLLTFRALRLMQQADVVLYDRLVADAIVDLTRKDAARIYVGKKRDQHTLPQESINELLVRQAKEGKRVVRLKGGDPFIFGRGGEEIATLSEEGISFQVVPGITAASGCASYAGIPLTHRDYAQSCVFVTGHLRDGSIDLHWESLVHKGQTVVIYMGLIGLEKICSELIAHGMSEKMPAALIQQGTTINQYVLTGTLKNLSEKVETKGIQAPTLIIVGEVVKLHRDLNWFNPVPS